MSNSEKKVFDLLDGSKKRSLDALNKLESTIKIYQDTIDRGEKPSLALCMQLNKQLDLYKLINRENDKLFDKISNNLSKS